MGKFNGKYKAYVKNIDDPLRMGRIQVNCPAITLNYITGWCDPCFPCESDFYLPPVGSCVWIEFQRGDIDKPVWLGGWYGENQAPSNTSERIISYGGALISLHDGKVFLNGVDVLSEIASLKSQIASLDGRLKILESTSG